MPNEPPLATYLWIHLTALPFSTSKPPWPKEKPAMMRETRKNRR